MPYINRSRIPVLSQVDDTMRFLHGISFSFLHLFFLTLFVLINVHAFKATSTKRSLYIVHMDLSHMPRAFSSHHNWFSSMIDSLKFDMNPNSLDNLPSPFLIYTYNKALHGFSAFLSLEELEALKKSAGFITIHDDTTLTSDTTYTPQFLKLSPFTGLWSNSNLGNNIIIGVVDGGVWPESLSFKDHGLSPNVSEKWKGSCEGGEDFNSSMCNYKLIGARYFNQGIKKSKPGEMKSKDSARDTLGHGTIVSSIAAGNHVDGVSYFGYAKGTARGIAPHARLAVYKVSWEEGIDPSDFLAGIEQAIDDGVDVISISLYGPRPVYNNSVAIASFSAMEKGILVVCAGGNTGPAHGTVHNDFPWVLTVAAGTTDRWFAGIVTLPNGVNIVGWSLFLGTNSSLQKLPLVYNKSFSRCNSSSELSEAPADSIIICDNIGYVSRQLALLAHSNVTGAILISNSSRPLDFQYFQCSCVVISSNDAIQVIRHALHDITPLASIEFQQTLIDTNLAPLAARYSSRGPSQSFQGILKPDVMAPGSLILGAWPPNVLAGKVGKNVSLFNDYNIVSGSSIACPHVTGVAALLKAKHPEWSPAAIRSAIMTTANPLDKTRNPVLELDIGNDFQLASPLAMGAGYIDPNRALNPGLIYDVTRQDYINLLCTMNIDRKQLSAITRSSTYNCLNKSSDLNYPSFIALYNHTSFPMVKEFQRIVTNIGEDIVTYKAMVRAPPSCTVNVSPKQLVFKTMYEKHSYTLTLKYKGNNKRQVYFGELVWIEKNGKRKVRSPIVVSPNPNGF